MKQRAGMKLRRRALELHAEARKLASDVLRADAAIDEGGGSPAAAVALVDRIDTALDELRARGYRELPDGRWVNPSGVVVPGTRRR